MSLNTRKGIENKVADVLSRVSGVELFSLVIFTTNSKLLQAISHNWDTHPDLKMLIEQLKVIPAAHS